MNAVVPVVFTFTTPPVAAVLRLIFIPVVDEPGPKTKLVEVGVASTSAVRVAFFAKLIFFASNRTLDRPAPGPFALPKLKFVPSATLIVPVAEVLCTRIVPVLLESVHRPVPLMVKSPLPWTVTTLAPDPFNTPASPLLSMMPLLFKLTVSKLLPPICPAFVIVPPLVVRVVAPGAPDAYNKPVAEFVMLPVPTSTLVAVLPCTKPPVIRLPVVVVIPNEPPVD